MRSDGDDEVRNPSRGGNLGFFLLVSFQYTTLVAGQFQRMNGNVSSVPLLTVNHRVLNREVTDLGQINNGYKTLANMIAEVKITY